MAETRPGYCKCGCGQLTRIADENRPEKGWVKGQPRDFLRGHHGWVLTREESFWARVTTGAPDQCWEWAATRGPAGYGRFKFRGITHPAHRVAWELTNGPISDGLLVCHRCDNPPCVNPDHLWLGTTADNIADRVRKGRTGPSHGAANGAAKLTADDVAQIRFRCGRGETQRSVAEDLGVSPSNISQILRGKTWTQDGSIAKRNKPPQ